MHNLHEIIQKVSQLKQPCIDVLKSETFLQLNCEAFIGTIMFLSLLKESDTMLIPILPLLDRKLEIRRLNIPLTLQNHAALPFPQFLRFNSIFCLLAAGTLMARGESESPSCDPQENSTNVHSTSCCSQL